MVGHKWEPAQGTIARAWSEPDRHGGSHGPINHYEVEVRNAHGGLIRGKVDEKHAVPRPVGSLIGVEIHSKSNEMRLDPNAMPAESIRGAGNMAQQMRVVMDAAGGAAAVAGLAGLAGALGSGQVHVFGAGGQELPTSAIDPTEMHNLVEAMRSGDPAAKQAAMARLHEIRNTASQQAAGLGQAGPGQFGPGQPGQYGPDQFGPGQYGPGQYGPGQAAPASAGGFSGPGPSTFGSPAVPEPFQPASTPSSFGSFDHGPGEGTREQRMAKLQDLFNKGILTESEFEAQRQQVLNGG